MAEAAELLQQIENKLAVLESIESRLASIEKRLENLAGQPTQQQLDAAFGVFDWIARMKPVLERRAKERQQLTGSVAGSDRAVTPSSAPVR
ncbi:MAG: hypothetical protein GQ578_09730 [Desulfuromonadaceae bacterium]|nr:hypothetical protein [Desulfuromonadaceae bacterium]